MNTIQMDLFEATGIEIPNKPKIPPDIKWSYSKRNMLEQCPRRYYYEYYGSNKRVAKNDPQKETLRFLKKLQNRHLRVGDILHRIIKIYLKKLQDGKHFSFDWLKQMALNDFRKDVKFSQQYKRGKPSPDEKYPPNLLLEFYYGQSDAESLYIESEERIIKALTNFLKSQNFAQFRDGATDPSALIETPANMKNNYFSLSGKIDLAYRKNGKINVVDWKTRGSSSGDDSLQMLAYALWAKHQFKCPVDAIFLHKVY